MNKTKQELLDKGIELAEKICKRNLLTMPIVKILGPEDRHHHLGSCAFYRYDNKARCGVITIMPSKCAHPGNGKRSWSWPGYVIDRTPYGVIQHELGHHMDFLFGAGKYRLLNLWKQTGDKPITGYHGTGDHWVRDERNAEDFAEMFRLFVTNPSLLNHIRPKTYRLLSSYLVPVELRTWNSVLRNAPKGILKAAHNRVQKASNE